MEFLDLAEITTTTTGTGAYDITGSAESGYQDFTGFSAGAEVPYRASMGDDFEVGLGTISGTTLIRTTIHESTNSDAAVDWGAGNKTLCCVTPAWLIAELDTLNNNTSGTNTGDQDLSGYLTSETVTSLSLSANVLSYVDEDSVTHDMDLSLYLDDTNLARIVSGTLDGATGIATFTRDDSTTFTIDMSALLDDTTVTVTDTLTSVSATDALSANQGRVLNDGKVDNSRVQTDVPAGAVFTDTTYSVGDGGLTEKNYTAADKAVVDATSGTNTGDQDLSGYSLTSHNHAATDVTDFDTEVANNSAVTANTAKNTYPSSDSTKVGYITVTQAVNLDTIESNVATNTAKTGVTDEISNVVEDTTPQLGGSLDLNSNALTSEHTAGAALVLGNVCYMNSSSQMVLADAVAVGTVSGYLALCTEAISSGSAGTFVFAGKLSGLSGLTAGGICYVSNTAGAITQTAPTTGFVRVIGYADSTTSIIFQPSPVWVEI